MIDLQNISKETPYNVFKEKYTQALNAGQRNIEAISIATFNKKLNEVDSRFVNLKIIDNKQFIFFTNYNSPKSVAFKSHNQISATFFWSSINCQIRMKAKINKTANEFNMKYFKKRSIDKNALAISSNQSKVISSYEEVIIKYDSVKVKEDLLICPDYWGGFTFKPYSFEFWEGHDSRINKRRLYEEIGGSWKVSFLEP